jgi:hypothetical protein
MHDPKRSNGRQGVSGAQCHNNGEAGLDLGDLIRLKHVLVSWRCLSIPLIQSHVILPSKPYSVPHPPAFLY